MQSLLNLDLGKQKESKRWVNRKHCERYCGEAKKLGSQKVEASFEIKSAAEHAGAEISKWQKGMENEDPRCHPVRSGKPDRHLGSWNERLQMFPWYQTGKKESSTLVQKFLQGGNVGNVCGKSYTAIFPQQYCKLILPLCPILSYYVRLPPPRVWTTLIPSLCCLIAS